ncbi:zinc finger protein 714 [Danaus plexippus]|uniref:zinc finger protein 714 n=1 Tax=Danaus plexippus TaxID=13037 RepID=UPI002AB0DCC4|nr:zinc finger protein 714 [Danaus plexippus]
MNKICRICLEEGVLSSIFVENYSISICEMIEYCSNIKISRNDGLPEQMCSNCMYKLGIAYHFKQTCERADVRLRQYLGIPKQSKVSDAMVMTDPIVMTQTTIIKRCKCKQDQKKNSSNYKRKPESEKLKRGPKPKPKKVHSCYQCNKEFRCQAQLDMHVRTHTGDKPFECMYCPQRFTQKHNLTIHLRVHTGEKPFQCEVCSKRFSAQGNLQAHLKIHTGQKDHVCALCNKSFITSSELTRHMCKHRGVKNFKCDLCSSAYIHSRDLKLHKLKKHQIGDSMKNQNEFDSSKNIDIVCIDDVKNDHNIKEGRHYNSLPDNKIQEHLLPDSNSMLPYKKDVKNMYHVQFQNKTNDVVNYMDSYSQHCMQHHKVESLLN